MLMPWRTSLGLCRGCDMPMDCECLSTCWLSASLRQAEEYGHFRTGVTPAAESAAIMQVMQAFPPELDLPTVLWGASAALLALRSDK